MRTKKQNRPGTGKSSEPRHVPNLKAVATKTAYMLVNDCPDSPFGIHVPDTFTLEGDLLRPVAEFECVHFSISCKCCRKKGVGVIPLADIHWED